MVENNFWSDAKEVKADPSFWNDAKAVDAPNETVFDAENDRIISVPQTLNVAETEFLIKKDVDKETNFFGFEPMGVIDTLGKGVDDYVKIVGAVGTGATSFAFALPQVGGGLLKEAAETALPTKESEAKFVEEAMLEGRAPTGGAVESIINFFGKEDVTKKADEIIARNNEFIKKANLTRPEGAAGVAFDVGSGGSSILTAIGLTMLTKNPVAAATFFGAMQKSSVYQEAIAAGETPAAASAISNVAGTVEAGLEFVGVDVLMKAMKGNSAVKRFIKGFATEFTQEAAQTGSEELITQISGIRTKEFDKTVQEILYSGFLGGFLGGGTSLTIGAYVTDEALKQDIPESIALAMGEYAGENYKDAQENALEFVDKELSPIALDTKDVQASMDSFQKFSNGIEIMQAENLTESEQAINDGLAEAFERFAPTVAEEDIMDVSLGESLSIIGSEAAEAQVLSEKDFVTPETTLASLRSDITKKLSDKNIKLGKIIIPTVKAINFVEDETGSNFKLSVDSNGEKIGEFNFGDVTVEASIKETKDSIFLTSLATKETDDRTKIAEGTGRGSEVVNSLIDLAKKQGKRFVVVGALDEAAPFYEKFGLAHSLEKFNGLEEDFYSKDYSGELAETLEPNLSDMKLSDVKELIKQTKQRIPKLPTNLTQMIRDAGGINEEFADSFDLKHLTGLFDRVTKNVFVKYGGIDKEDSLVDFLVEYDFMTREEAEQEDAIDVALDIMDDSDNTYNVEGKILLEERENTIDNISRIETLLEKAPVEEVVKSIAELKKVGIKAINKETVGDVINLVKEFKSDLINTQKIAKTNAQKARQMLVDIVNSSGLTKEDTAKFITDVKNLQSTKQLADRLPKIRNKIDKLVDVSIKKDVYAKLKNELKKTKVKKQAGKPVGKFTPELQIVFDTLRDITKLSKKDASEQLNKRLESDSIPSPIEALENQVLAIVADEGISSIDSLNTLDEVLNAISSAREGKRVGKIAKAIYIQDTKDELVNLIGGIKDVGAKKARRAMNKFFKNIEETFIAQNGAWETKLRFLFQSSDKAGVNEMIDKLHLTNETRSFETGKADMLNNFNKRAMKAFDLKTDRQVMKRLQIDDTVTIDLGKFTFSDGVQRNLELTKAQIRKRWMEMQDPQLREVLANPQSNAYTEDIFQTIENSMNESDIRFAQAELDFYQEYYARINEKYKELYGVNLPKVEFYSPIKREFASEETDEFLKGILYRGGIAQGSLKSRSPSIRRLTDLSDVQALYSHIQEMEYFIAYANKVALLNSVIRNPQTQKAMSDSFGDTIKKTINSDLDYFANRGANISIAGEALYRTLVRNFGFAQLAIKTQIGLKQVVSFPAYAEDVKTADFIAGLAKFSTNPKKALEIMSSSELWKNRGIGLDKDFQDMMSDKNFLNLLAKYPTVTNMMMIPIKYGDKGAILIGGYAHYYAKIKAGATHEEAIKSFERRTALTQQSTDPDQLSELQRSNSLVRSMVQFMSSPNALMRAEYNAILEYRRGRTSSAELAKSMFLFHILIPNLFTYVANGFTWDDEDQLAASMLGSLNGILIFGQVIEAMVSAGVKGDYFAPKVRHVGTSVDLILKASKTIEDATIEDFLNGNKSISKMLDGVGGLFGVPLKTLHNQIVGINEGINASSDDDVIKSGALILGYSPYIIDKKILGEDVNKSKQSPRI